MASNQETIIVKISIPTIKVVKTFRVEAKAKVRQLQENLIPKIKVVAPHESFEKYAFCWNSDSGTLWLSDTSTLKSYNLKDNVTLEFREKPVRQARGATITATKTYALTPQTTDNIKLSSLPPVAPTNANRPARENARPLSTYNHSTSTSASTHQPSRPMSTYNSLSIAPQKKNDWSAVRPVSSSLLQKEPSFDDGLSPKGAYYPKAVSTNSIALTPTIDDLDSLIDSFDDVSTGNTQQSNYLPGLGQFMPSYQERPQEQPQLDDYYSYGNQYPPTSTLPYTPQPSEQSTNYKKPATYYTPDKSYDAPVTTNYGNKRDKLAVLEGILSDALSGIESGAVDLDLAKHYIISALCIVTDMHS